MRQRLTVSPGEAHTWGIVADVNQGPAAVRNTLALLHSGQDLASAVLDDIRVGTRNLERLISTADGIQVTGDTLRANHPASTVVFNIMRCGWVRET